MMLLLAVSLQCPPGYQEEWANSLGYGSTQDAVGKNGAGKGKGFGKDQKGGSGKGFGNDQKGKDGGQGAGKGERPAGACSHC